MRDGMDAAALERAQRELHADGQTIIRGLVEPSVVEGWRSQVLDTVANMDALELPPGNEVYQRAFDQFMNLWEFDSNCGVVALSEHLGSTAAALLDVEAVRLYHDQALIKKARGGRTPWHQDQWYWPLDTNRTITMWLALHDFDEDMGELEFALGTHREPITTNVGGAPISASSDEFYEQWLNERSTPRRRTGVMRAGDASFHLGWTLHRAEPNHTRRDREVMTVIWFADGARLVEPSSPEQMADRQRWLPGTEVGEIAASRLNPLTGARK